MGNVGVIAPVVGQAKARKISRVRALAATPVLGVYEGTDVQGRRVVSFATDMFSTDFTPAESLYRRDPLTVIVVGAKNRHRSFVALAGFVAPSIDRVVLLSRAHAAVGVPLKHSAFSYVFKDGPRLPDAVAGYAKGHLVTRHAIQSVSPPADSNR